MSSIFPCRAGFTERDIAAKRTAGLDGAFRIYELQAGDARVHGDIGRKIDRIVVLELYFEVPPRDVRCNERNLRSNFSKFWRPKENIRAEPLSLLNFHSIPLLPFFWSPRVA